jgi:TIR domain
MGPDDCSEEPSRILRRGPEPGSGSREGTLAHALGYLGLALTTIGLTARLAAADQEGRPVAVFISYSKKDQKYYSLLYNQLAIVEMNGFRVFASPLIRAGALRHKETSAALATAQVALLLVSDNYINTKAIIHGELPKLLRGAATRGTRILAVIVDWVAFDYVERLAKFQPFNDPSEPLSGLPVRDRKRILMNLSIEVLEDLQDRKRP